MKMSEKNNLLFENYKRNKTESLREQIFFKNIKLVDIAVSICLDYYNASEINISSIDIDDMYQTGYEALLSSIDNYDLSYNASFSGYAIKAIIRKIDRCVGRVIKNSPNTINIKNDISELAIDEEYIGTEEEALEKVSLDEIMKIIEILPERKRQIIQMRFGICGYRKYTCLELADIFETTFQNILYLERKTIEIIKGIHEGTYKRVLK